MTLKQYNWKNGPDLIQQHSVAKHRILQAYLAAYFRTLVSSPNQDVLRVTLVDGFAGGGLYVHNDTRETVKGSPFIFLEATREADFLINHDRRKPVQLQVDYFFTEADRHAYGQRRTSEITQLTGGVGGLCHLMKHYHADFTNKIKAPAPKYPVIVLVDNDAGAKDIYGAISGITKKPRPTGTEQFIHVVGNLYVVPTPLGAGGAKTAIEDFFDAKTLAETLGTKERLQNSSESCMS